MLESVERTAREKRKVVYKGYIACERAAEKQDSEIPEIYRIREGQATQACVCPFKVSITEKNGLWTV
jgi:hypothetical protein